MPEQEQPGEALPAGDQITQYERKLKSEWRSLLLEDTDSPPQQKRANKSSYLFRPRASTALDLDIDLDTLVRKAGDTLGDFRLERLIGQGAMGQVWEALQVSLQRQVALKLIRPDRVTPDLLRYFRREGRAGGRLQHPGIVAVFAMGQTEGVHWIAQELVEGECTFHTFLSELKEKEDMPGDYDRRIALFFYQLAEALQFAHEAGVIHRDLKPQNVLVTHGDRPKISDFGVARILDEGTITQEGGIQGTPRYMSPEQVLGVSSNIGPASDQFSLGAMLYKALTLKDATEGDSLHAVLHAVTKITPPKPTKFRPEMSRDLEAIVMKAIEKLPQDRYASLLDFQSDLGNYLDGRATEARQVGALERATKWVRRNPLPSTAAAVLLVLTAAIGILTWALGDSREATRLEEYRVQVSEGRRHLERGDPALAMASFLSAAALRPTSPESPILLASLAARGARYREAERRLKDAEDLGYVPADPDVEDAREQYLRGLYLFARGRQPRYEEAAEALERAIELDETRRDAWYPLYLIRAAQERHDAAAAALREYREGLAIGDTQARIAEALIAEEENKLIEARSILEELGGEVDSDSSRRFEVLRALGRIALLQEDYEEATKALSQALSIVEDDSGSRQNLAIAQFYLGRASKGQDRESWLQLAEESAEQALLLEHSATDSLWLLAEIEFLRVGTEGGPARERFRADSPTDERLLIMDAEASLRRAESLWQAGRYPEAVTEYRSILDMGLNSLPALTMIANDLYFAETPSADQEALDLLQTAFTSWKEQSTRSHVLWIPPSNRRKTEKRVQTMLVTRYAIAARQGEIGTALETKEALEDELLRVPFHEDAERLTYAEALVHNTQDELIDRERARELLQEYLENPQPAPASAAEQYRSTIANIEAGLK